MSDIKERLAQKVAAAQSLVKVAGDCCSHESAKNPENLIDGTADVQVEGNTPAGVTIPGEKGMSDSGLTSEDKGTDVGHVADDSVKTTEGAETVDGNAEVDEFIASAEEFKKQASALKAFAQQILSLPDSAFSVGVPKTASAELTEKDVEDFIVKRANAGDPVCQGMLNYCAAFYKMAAGEDAVPAEAIAEGGGIEAGLAQVQEQVAAAIKQEYPDIDDAAANEIAAQATAQAVQDAIAGGEVQEGEEPTEEQIATELVTEVAAQLKQQVPDLSDEDAEALAVQAVSDTLSGNNPELAGVSPVSEEAAVAEELPKAASAENSETCDGKKVDAELKSDAGKEVKSVEVTENKVEVKSDEASPKTDMGKKASAEETVAAENVETPEGSEEVVAEAPAETPTEEGALNQDAVAEEVGNIVLELAQEIKAQDPSISDEEAIQGAADAVADALNTVDVQQAIGEVGEDGTPVMDDATAQGLVNELGKTAAANPLRDLLTPAMNSLLHLSPENFAKRIGAI